MKVRLFSVQQRRQFKAAERAADRAAQQAGRAEARQRRNRFIPQARQWVIEQAPIPLGREVLD